MRDPPVADPAADAIKACGVNKWYGSFHALRDIDLVFARGERAVVWGPSGSGKSTLIRCLAGLEPFQEGLVEIAGTRMIGSSTLRIKPARRVGMVFQSFNLFPHLTVLENCTLGPTDVLRMPRLEAQERALTFLAKVRMAEYAERYPQQLSGGQQQRAAIARALCMEPEVLLLDEPTSALDPELKAEVRDVIVALAREGMTMIVVSHEVELARSVAGRMVVMESGAVVGDSAADAFFARQLEQPGHFDPARRSA